MKKKLAIIRADESQMPFVLKAKEMGIETHCFAWDKEGYTHCKGIADYFHPISILDKEKILEKCKELKVDGVFTKSDNAVATAAFVAEGMGLIGNNYEDMVIAANKYQARKTMFEKGVNSPRFVFLQKGQETIDVSGLKYPLIVKPTDRKGSIGVVKVRNEAELKEGIQNAQKLSFNGEVLIEEFIQGSEVLEVMGISWNGKHYFLAIEDSENINNETSFYKLGFSFPAKLNDEERQKVNTQAALALDALNFKYGATDVEVILGDDGKAYIVEANPRMAGEWEHLMLELSTGYDYLKGAINVALNNFEEPVLPLNKCSGLYYLRPESEYLRPVIENWKDDPEIIEAEIFNKAESGQPLGYLVYQSDRKRCWKPGHIV